MIRINSFYFPERHEGKLFITETEYGSCGEGTEFLCCINFRMALGSTQPLTKMSTRSISWG
jgi:hypothetical protein